MEILTAYFSCTGRTRKAAERLAGSLGSDIYEIRPLVEYTEEDLAWKHGNRSSNEMEDPEARPKLKDPCPDISGYDIICIGFPIWWNTAPRIINSFIEGCGRNAFKDKTVFLFATSGSQDISNAESDLRKKYDLNIKGSRLIKDPDLDIRPGSTEVR
ncbi:MAG: flavodoxin [Oscillospiraceae bacterium]|jgi:flavodoxin